MRSFIYRHELNYFFQEYSVDDQTEKGILNDLFDSPFGSRSKQLLLKSKFSSTQQFDEILEKRTTDKKLIGAIKSLFEVTDDLYLPSDLKRKILENEQVAAFIGAGVSANIGYPLWNELANSSIYFMFKKDIINHFEYRKLNNEIDDPKQKLSIFDKLCGRSTSLGQEFYKKHLKEKNTENEDIDNPYDIIVSPVFNWLMLTSNVDYSLCRSRHNHLIAQARNTGESDASSSSSQEMNLPTFREFKKQNIVSRDFSINDTNNEMIYYLHGELDYLQNTIFTTEDYIKHYFRKESNLRNYLRNIFNEYTVLFLGYGLAEFPILEGIIGNNNQRHYNLMPTNLSEMNVFRKKQSYYDTLNISLIPYYLDFNGFDRLFSVLENWEEELLMEQDQGYMDNLELIDKEL